jgi:hypothetical protein
VLSRFLMLCTCGNVLIVWEVLNFDPHLIEIRVGWVVAPYARWVVGYR